MEQEFSRTELAVVVEAHGMAVCACVVDDQDVAVVDFRQAAVDGEFIAVFAERTGDVIDVVFRCIFLAHDRDVMVRAVHARTHEVGHAGIDADVFLPDVFVMDSRRDR